MTRIQRAHDYNSHSFFLMMTIIFSKKNPIVSLSILIGYLEHLSQIQMIQSSINSYIVACSSRGICSLLYGLSARLEHQGDSPILCHMLLQ